MKLCVANNLPANNITFSQTWSSLAKYPWQLTEVNKSDRHQLIGLGDEAARSLSKQLLHQRFSITLSLKENCYDT